ncbi:hypothetical protein SLEP1_g14046 [Rubroshorea leprosula]|uniref:Uncharacterized protein n=1 Tax=Rubroshorea leprosula TaxID=152421 RepID=A0AAV5INU2_9ROSI|nr:hypothetical protein SLEP1_g14046 [Rubroshorea leprosula]
MKASASHVDRTKIKIVFSGRSGGWAYPPTSSGDPLKIWQDGNHLVDTSLTSLMNARPSANLTTVTPLHVAREIFERFF